MSTSRITTEQAFLTLTFGPNTPSLLRDLALHSGGPVATELGRHGGRVFEVYHQRLKVVFHTPGAALTALLAARQKLTVFALAHTGDITLQVALHYGPSVASGSSYSGETLRYVEYMLLAAHPGQILLSQAAVDRLGGELPPGTSLIPLGPQRLKDLTPPQPLHQLNAPGFGTSFPPLRTLDQRPHNLPILPSSLIGRQQDVAQLSLLLDNPEIRLITLVGPSGTGKSRLALQMAAERMEQYADGVFFVGLAPIDDPEMLLSTIAHAANIEISPTQPMLDTLQESFRPRQLLLILDNFEQLLPMAPLVGVLLAAAPRLTILVTSHLPLGLPEEQVFALPPLGLPATARFAVVESLVRYPAVALFIERARRMRASFEVTRENAEALAGLCLHLEGLPLALELVAAYADQFEPAQLLAQLEQTRERDDVLADLASFPSLQQQTLRRVLRWSYDLLGPEEQVLFARMGVLVGSGTTAQVAAVCGEAGDTPQVAQDRVLQLQRRNLLVRETLAVQGDDRWTMLDMVHDYAVFQLHARGEVAQVRDRHSAYFLALVERGGPELVGPDQQRWLEELAHEYGNLLGALAWLSEQDRCEEALRFVVAFWKFWQFRAYHHEGRRWLERLIAQAERRVADASAAGDEPQVRTLKALMIKALYAAGWLANDQGDFNAKETLFVACLAFARELDDKQGMMLALQGVGSAAHLRGDVNAAMRSFEESLALARALQDREETAWVLDHLGRLALYQGHLDESIAFHDESMQIFHEVQHEWGAVIARIHIADSLVELGDAARIKALMMPWLADWRARGKVKDLVMVLGLANLCDAEVMLDQLEAGRLVVTEALDSSREMGYEALTARLLGTLGALEHKAGHADLSIRAYQESLRVNNSAREYWTIARNLEGIAAVLAGQPAQATQATQLLAASEALRATRHLPRSPYMRPFYERALAEVRARLSQEDFAAAWAAGQALDEEQAIAAALAAEGS